jgi:glycosyltransferase involved in cell wall biosynthesis
MKRIFKQFFSMLGLEISRIKTPLTNADTSVDIDPALANVCICSPEQDAVSETFIKAHVNHINANCFFLYGGSPPSITGSGQRISDWGNDLRSGFINYLRINKIDVLLAEYGTTGANIFELCREARVPLIVYFHGFDATVHSTVNDFRAKYKDMFQYATHIFVVSKEMENRLLDLGCPKDKLINNPCAPNDSFFQIMPDYQSHQFLSVGRFVNKKAPYLTLAAFYEVYKHNQKARLIMAGDGYLKECCEHLSNHWGIDDAVSFPGNVDPDTVKRLMSESLCFVQHSITASDGNTEGTPVGILEACASAIPVVSTRHAGIKDVIIENETGLLVDELDISGMADRMIAILEDKNLAKKIGENARVHVKSNYSMRHHIGAINTAIDKTVINR